MQQIWLKRLTASGDPTLLVCAGLALFLYFWIVDEHRELSRPWLIALLLCLSMVVSAKLGFYLLSDNEFGPQRLRSPSGHVAIATTFYGCLAVILTTRQGVGRRLLIASATLGILLLLAISRVLLGLHTIPEIVVAFAIGGSAVLFFRIMVNPWPIATVNPAHVIAVLLLAVVTHYVHVDGERLIQHFVTTVGHSGIAAIRVEMRGQAAELRLDPSHIK